MLMKRVIAAVGLALLVGAACSGDSPGGSAQKAPLEEADSFMGERRHAEAAAAYGRAFDGAIGAGDCARAERAARGLRDAVYLARGTEPLAAAEERALGAAAGAPCLLESLVQLALARDLLGEPEAGKRLLDRAREGSADSSVRLRLGRALELLGRAPSTRLEPVRVVTTPGGAGDPAWEAASPVTVDRADQVVEGADAWRGPSDASLRLRSAVLNRNLFFLVEIRDDDPAPEDAEEDALLIVFNLERGQAPLLRRTAGPGARTLALAVPTGPTEGRVAVPAPRRAWRSAVATREGRAIVFCLPQECVEELTTEAGDSYAFDVLYRDRDAGGVSRLRAWSPEIDPAAMFLSGVIEIPDEFPAEPE